MLWFDIMLLSLVLLLLHLKKQIKNWHIFYSDRWLHINISEVQSPVFFFDIGEINLTFSLHTDFSIFFSSSGTSVETMFSRKEWTFAFAASLSCLFRNLHFSVVHPPTLSVRIAVDLVGSGVSIGTDRAAVVLRPAHPREGPTGTSSRTVCQLG